MLQRDAAPSAAERHPNSPMSRALSRAKMGVGHDASHRVHSLVERQLGTMLEASGDRGPLLSRAHTPPCDDLYPNPRIDDTLLRYDR